MPTNLVRTAEQERLWQKAKKQAEKQGHGADYAYIVGIYKKMGGLEKALLSAGGIAGHARIPGQVPNRENIEALRLVQTPAKPFSIARLMAHDEPRMTVGSIVDDLGMAAPERQGWLKFLANSMSAANEVTLRQDIMSKCLTERMDQSLRGVILQRALVHWRGLRKGLIAVVTPDDLARQKGRSRQFVISGDLTKGYGDQKPGHKYISRERGKGGEWQYTYPEDLKNRIVNAIMEFLANPNRELTVGSTARSFRVDKQVALSALQDLAAQGKIEKQGDKWVGKRKLALTEGKVGEPGTDLHDLQREHAELTKRIFKVMPSSPLQKELKEQAAQVAAKIQALGGVVHWVPGSTSKYPAQAITNVSQLDDDARYTLWIKHPHVDKWMIQRSFNGIAFKGAYVHTVGDKKYAIMPYGVDPNAKPEEKKPEEKKPEEPKKESGDTYGLHKNSTIAEITQTARRLGKEAHDAGRARIMPSNVDKVLAVLNPGGAFGDEKSSAFMREYLRGWDKARIDEPLPEPPEAPKVGKPTAVAKPTTTSQPGPVQPTQLGLFDRPISADDAASDKSVEENADKVARSLGKGKESAGKGARKVLAVEQGEHVWGSRADLFAEINSSADIAKLTPEDQARFATKKYLMPTTDLADSLKQGKTPGHVLMRRAVESCIQAEADNNLEARQLYMDGINFVQRSLDKLSTAEDVHDFVTDYGYLIKGRKRGPLFTSDQIEQMRDKYMVAKGTPVKVSWQERKKLAAVVTEKHKAWRALSIDDPKREAAYAAIQAARAEEQKAKPDVGTFDVMADALGFKSYNMGFEYTPAGYQTFIPDPDLPARMKDNPYARMAAALGVRFIKLVGVSAPHRNGPKVYQSAATQVQKWAADKADAAQQIKDVEAIVGSKGKAAPQRAKFKWERIVSGEIRRTGGEPVTAASPKMFADEFGFKNVQFGNWVTEGDANSHLKGAHGALRDLADVMGIDRNLVSFKGRLAIAFGARGSGNASAHYEPSKAIINLTKVAGGGSLAHEWAHAMDNLVAKAHAPGSTKAGLHMSEGKVPGVPQEVADAFANVMHTVLYKSDVDPKMALEHAELKARSLDKTQYFSRNHRYMLKRLGERLSEKRSDFYKDGEALCTDKKGYWTLPHEMFARAFEAYIQDTLDAKDRRSTYLVDGTAHVYQTYKFRNEQDMKSGRHAQPYPQGAERKRINEAMGALIETLRQSKTLEKAMRFIIWQDQLNKGLGEERPGHKYLKRVRGKDGEWEYTYADETPGSSGAAARPREQLSLFIPQATANQPEKRAEVSAQPQREPQKAPEPEVVKPEPAKTEAAKPEEAKPVAGEQKGYSREDVLAGKGPYKVGDSLSAKHDSPETAYVIDDYPYGGYRTQKRMWIESGKQGQRIGDQTKNPKTGKWNQPHYGTYSDMAGLRMEDGGYVRVDGASIAYGKEKLEEFKQKYPGMYEKLPKANQIRIDVAIQYHKDTSGGMSHADALKRVHEYHAQQLKERGVVDDWKKEKEAKEQAKKEKALAEPEGAPPVPSERQRLRGMLTPKEAAALDSPAALKEHITKHGSGDYFKARDLHAAYKKLAQEAESRSHNKLATQYKHLGNAVRAIGGYGEPNATAVKAFENLKAHVKKHGTAE